MADAILVQAKAFYVEHKHASQLIIAFVLGFAIGSC